MYACVTVFKVTRKSIEKESGPVELRKDSLISLSAPKHDCDGGYKVRIYFGLHINFLMRSDAVIRMRVLGGGLRGAKVNRTMTQR